MSGTQMFIVPFPVLEVKIKPLYLHCISQILVVAIDKELILLDIHQDPTHLSTSMFFVPLLVVYINIKEKT